MTLPWALSLPVPFCPGSECSLRELTLVLFIYPTELAEIKTKYMFKVIHQLFIIEIASKKQNCKLYTIKWIYVHRKKTEKKLINVSAIVTEQMSENNSPRSQLWPKACVCKILLEHSHAHSCRGFFNTTTELTCPNRDYVAYKPKILTFWPLAEKLCLSFI